ncbi:MAG: PLDc N-terminal domain-containing protein [Promethearchaeota archaeon]
MCKPFKILIFAVPLILIHFSLAIYSLHNLFKSNTKSSGAKISWTIIILILNLIGPLLYIFFGMEKLNVDDT